MIFLDESGKRWRQIKFGTGLLSTTTVTPVVVILVASLLYLPSWGSLSLPAPFSAQAPQVKSDTTTRTPESASSSGQSTAASSRTSETSDTSPTTDASQSSAGLVPSSAETTPTTTTTPTTSPTTTPTTTPAQTGQGLVNQPDQTGNSDYGRSRQATRF